ncbi:30541_t:CDS:1, partial [Gigaspora margarita]
ATQEIARERKNCLERECYTKCISRNETLTTGPSEMFCKRKNCLAREADACCTTNETVEDAEQHQSAQRQTYAHQHEEEFAEQTEIRRKKQRNAKHKVTKAACCENYNTNDVTSLNIGQMNVLCSECKALH